MITVELRRITKENLDEVLSLRVSETQKSFVSSVAESLAEAYVYSETAFPFAIYADGAAVGFLMMGYYEAREQYTLWKLLVDQRFQGRGYGREALKQGLLFLKNTFGAKEIFLGVAQGNEAAKHLYRSLGFAETGRVEDRAEEMKYSCE